MISHRITKYNPAKRNPDGSYQDSREWTSISDIGRPGFDCPTYKQYITAEDGYVHAVMTILKEYKCEGLAIVGLEATNTKTDFADFVNSERLKGLSVDFESEIAALKNGQVLGINEIEKMIRLILRETIWMKLVSEYVELLFGYDYYVYVRCAALSKMTIKNIESKGVFVESGISQKEITDD